MLDQIKAHLYSSKIKIIRCQLALMNSSSIFDFVSRLLLIFIEYYLIV